MANGPRIPWLNILLDSRVYQLAKASQPDWYGHVAAITNAVRKARAAFIGHSAGAHKESSRFTTAYANHGFGPGST